MSRPEVPAEQPPDALELLTHGELRALGLMPRASNYTFLAEVSDGSVRVGYPGYVDAQAQAQARRESAMHGGKHR